jgi:hypothetical protein
MNRDLFHNRAEFFQELGNFIDRADGASIDDASFLGSSLGMLTKLYEDDGGITDQVNQLQLAAIISMGEAVDPDLLYRAIALRRYIVAALKASDAKFDESIRAGMAEIEATPEHTAKLAEFRARAKTAAKAAKR